MTPDELEAFLRDPTVPFERRRDRVKELHDVTESTAALALQSREVPNEDALEVLADIADATTPLDLLKKIATTEHEWDEFNQVGVKAVRAISVIRTPEATAALADIAEHGDEYVQHWARKAIGRR